MVNILPHIDSLKSYSPGKSPEAYQREYGFTRTAMLWNNENNAGVPQKAVERMRAAAEKVNVYPDPLSTELRTAIAELNGVNMENTVVGNGSESILNNIFKAFCAPGDEMITCSGTFVAVYIWAHSNRVESNKLPLKENYGFDLDALAAAVSENTKVVYVSNANNPTGTAFGEKELRDFLGQIPDRVLVVIDEAYFEYSRDLMADYPDTASWKADNVITLRTFSKAYGLAGVRLGYAVGPERLIEALNKVRMTFEPSLITQEAGLGALEDKAFLKDTVAANTKWLKEFKKAVDERGLKQSNSVANFIMIDLEEEERAARITRQFLEKGVFIRRLPAFGLPSCVRISTGTDAENQYFLEIFSKLRL